MGLQGGGRGAGNPRPAGAVCALPCRGGEGPGAERGGPGGVRSDGKGRRGRVEAVALVCGHQLA